MSERQYVSLTGWADSLSLAILPKLREPGLCTTIFVCPLARLLC